ncbi:hypothetical protein ACH5RR_006437 [Cinchona calisaya]|uniref:Transmembrane protein n=1 Tax=Cinchona calisaya TaxID=153742 RepID=A0ABD3AP20_9GENT
MGFSEPFCAGVVILQESIKLLSKNGKLIVLTILPTLLLTSISFVIFNLSYESLLRDMLIRECIIPLTSASSAEFSNKLAGLRENFGLMLVVHITFILSYTIISLFSITATVLIFSVSYTERTLSHRGFALLVLKSLKRPLITGFYTTMLDIGYIYFVLDLAGPLTFSGKTMGEQLGVLFLVAAGGYMWYLYFSMVWILGIVISVIEENCNGIEALGKAGKLIKGKRIQGYIMNIILVMISVLVVLLIQGFGGIRGHKWPVNDTIFGMFLVNLSCLLRLFHFVAHTVLYFQCKKNHGEEIEFLGEVEYTKTSTIPIVYDIP